MRKILAVVLGVLIANVVFFLGSVAADRFYPTPPELMDPQTPEATALRVAAAETNGLMLVILAGALGGLVGGFIGAKVGKGSTVAVTSAIGGLLSLWAVYLILCLLSCTAVVPHRHAHCVPGFHFSWRPCGEARSTCELGCSSSV